MLAPATKCNFFVDIYFPIEAGGRSAQILGEYIRNCLVLLKKYITCIWKDIVTSCKILTVGYFKMDFESPDVAKDFPGLYAPESAKRTQSRESDYSDEEKVSRKDLLGKRKDKKESKKDKGYVAFEGESSEDEMDETKSPGKKKNRSAFKFPGKDKKDKSVKAKDKETKDKKEEEKEAKMSKKESKDLKKESKKIKGKNKEEKKKKERSFKIKDKKKKNESEEKPVFGIPLQDAVELSRSPDGIEIPVIIRECIDYIEEHGLACEGIYRISGVKSKVRQLKSQYNRGEKVYLYEHEPHVVASLLKQFLRDLPEPILTNELIPKFEEAAGLKNESKRVEVLLALIESLPTCNRLLLSWIFVHMLHVVKLEKRNKMNLQNVSIALSPAMQISHRVLQVLFKYSDILFEATEIKKYVPPIEPDSTRLSLELPDSPTDIERELNKQESLLNIIHEELNNGLRNTEKEEQLWEVQRIVTQLKRKLRFLKQVQCSANPTTEENKGDVMAEKEPINVEMYPGAEFRNLCSDSGDFNNKVPKSQPSNPSISPELKSDNRNVLTVEDKISENVYSNSSVKEIPQDEKIHVKAELYSDEKIEEIDTNVSENQQSLQSEHIYNNSPLQVVQQSQPQNDNSDEIMALFREEMRLQVEEEELLLLGDELQRKINSEKIEIERLKQEIAEYEVLYRYRPFSLETTDNSSSDSDESSASNGEESHAVCILKELLKKNTLLEKVNRELSQKIQQERESCVDLKVRLKMAFEESKFAEV